MSIELARSLLGLAKRSGDIGALKDAFEVCRSVDSVLKVEVVGTSGGLTRVEETEEILGVHRISAQIREEARRLLSERVGDTGKLLELDLATLRFDAPHDFDAYCQFLESEREDARQFYFPRRPQLLVVAKELERLERGELDILGISLAPGTGKSELALFYLTWIGGRRPELANLAVSHSGNIIKLMYDELRRLVLPSGEYRFRDAFPKVRLAGTNGDLFTIDLEKRKRFPTFQFTSLGASNAGRVRAMNLLYCDDLVSSIEQAANPDQMDKLWRGYTVDCKQRKIGDEVKELHIATRWSQGDVIGRLEDINRFNPRAKFLNFPVCDSEGHSFFNYPYGVGYTDEMVKDLRESMEDVYFQSLYMGEPYEKDGQLYGKDELRRYMELPEREPDAVVAVCDTKTTGTDYCVMPIAYQYGPDYFIEDVVCENYAPDVVENSVVNMLLKHHVQQAQFESNVAGGKMAQVVQDRVNAAGGVTNVTSKWTQAHKETKIQVNSSWVKTHCVFRDDTVIHGKEWSEYRLFLRQLMNYSLRGKNKHDDVPDAMAQLALYVTKASKAKVNIVKRWF